MLRNYFFRTFTQPLARIYWRVFKPKTYGSRGIVLYGNQILLIKNPSAKHWSLPGGHIEKGETPEQCIIRELKEELDLSINKTEFKLGEYISDNEGKYDTVFIFVIKLPSPNFTKQWEPDDAGWFKLSELPTNISPAGLRRINEFQKDKKNLHSKW